MEPENQTREMIDTKNNVNLQKKTPPTVNMLGARFPSREERTTFFVKVEEERR